MGNYYRDYWVGFRTVTFFLLIVLLLASTHVESADVLPLCAEVKRRLRDCASYVFGRATQPEPSCCDAVRWLNRVAGTTLQRQSVCKCLKAFVAQKEATGHRASTYGMSSLPLRCGVRLGFPITQSLDCGRVRY